MKWRKAKFTKFNSQQHDSHYWTKKHSQFLQLNCKIWAPNYLWHHMLCPWLVLIFCVYAHLCPVLAFLSVCVVFCYFLVLSRQEVFTPWWLGRLWGQVLSKTQHMRSVTWSASDMSWASLLVVHDHHSMSWPTFHRSPHINMWLHSALSFYTVISFLFHLHFNIIHTKTITNNSRMTWHRLMTDIWHKSGLCSCRSFMTGAFFTNYRP